MNQLGQSITTLEIAEMMEVNHWEILRKLEGRTGTSNKSKGYIEILAANQMVVSDYFTESTYKDDSGKENKCYLVTKLGCDFLANKFTGEKGTLFTAKYVKRFRDMEERLQTPTSYLEILKNATLEVSQKVELVDKDLQQFKQDMPLLALEIQKITLAKNHKVVPLLGGKQAPAYQDRSLRGRVYRDLEHQIKREFGVETYKAIKRNQTDIALQIINSYELPLALKEEISDQNAQMYF